MKILEITAEKLIEENKKIQREVKRKITEYILAAFGLVTAFSWNETIKSLIEYFFPIEKNSLLAKFFYSLVLTFVVVFITVYLNKLFLNNDSEKNKN